MRAIAVAFAILLLAGCSSQADPSPSETDSRTFGEVAAKYQAKMDADPSVSDTQRALMDDAVSRGEVVLDDVAAAMRSQNECLLDAGFSTAGVSIDEAALPPTAMITAIRYPEDLTDNQANLVIDGCDRAHSMYVAWLYSAQPQSVEAYWIAADSHAPAIKQCLIDHGVPEDLIGGATTEIVEAAVKLDVQWEDFAQFPQADCFGDLPQPTRNR